MKICGEFGHSDFYETQTLKSNIKNKIISLIEDENYDTFLLGNKGNFDYTIAKYLKELKEKYPHIKRILVLTYLNEKITDYEKKYRKEMFDESVFPPLENTPLKYAYVKRNEWIVNQSDYILFYVDFKWGGAFNIFNYANRKHKNYINFGEL